MTDYLGMDRDIGSIEVGKRADLVVDGDPLADIRQSENITHPTPNGRLYDAATMTQQWPEQVERGPLFFELEGGDAWQPATMEELGRKARLHGCLHAH